MLIVVVTAVVNRSYAPQDPEAVILQGFGLLGQRSPQFRLFSEYGREVQDVKNAELAVIRGNTGPNVVKSLDAWRKTTSTLAVILHPEGGDLCSAMNLLPRPQDIQGDIFAELADQGRLLVYTRGGDVKERKALGRMVGHLASSCYSRNTDQFKKALQALSDAIQAYTPAQGSTGFIQAVNAATDAVGAWLSQNKPGMIAEPWNREADIVHFVNERLGHIIMDLQNWEDGRVDEEYLSRAFQGQSGRTWSDDWEAVKERVRTEFQGATDFFDGNAPMALERLLGQLRGRHWSDARSTLNDWTTERLRSELVGELLAQIRCK